MTELGKQVWKKMEEMGWQNAPEDFHLEYYENIIECTKQALTIPVVVGRSEQLCDHPRSERSYIGQKMLKCNKCGKEFS